MDAAAGTWVDTLVRLTAATGSRRGELLALQWTDFNFATGVLTISRSLSQTRKSLIVKPTKTRRTRRVPLPPSAVESLKMHWETQQQSRELFGPDYLSDLDLIFAGPGGGFLLPSSITRAVVRTAKSAGIGAAGLQALRHSHGSQLLSAGVPLPTVSRRLGHANVYTTANVYSHALPDDELAAAEKWEESMKAAKTKAAEAEKNRLAANGSTEPAEKFLKN